MKLKLMLTALAAFAAAAVFGKTLDNGFTYSTESPVVPGEFTAKFAEAVKMADEQHIPLVSVWAKSSCGQCKKLERANTHDDVIAWRKERGYIFVFGIDSEGEKGKVTIDGAEKEVTQKKFTKIGSNLPYVTIYWNKDGDAGAAYKNRKQFCGRENTMLVAADPSITDKDSRVADVFMRSVDSIVGSYKPSGGGATGPCGSFVTSGTESDRLEIESSTTNMYVGLKRPSNVATAVKAKLSLRGADGKELSSADVSWTNGQLSAFAAVDVATAAAAGQPATFVLLDEAGAPQASNTVSFVSGGNAAANPDFSGCAEFGRWTMDLEAAKELVASNAASAYTLVSIQGSLWCPDCANTDRNFLDIKDDEKDAQTKFQKWAVSKNVALVTVDIPNFKSETGYDAGGTPSLLSWDAYQKALVRNKTTDNPAISGGDPAETNMILRSGAGYLSRKGVSPEEAESWRLRNWDLARKNTSEGGFHRPEDTNPRRTGVPIFVLLRKDGTVAARFTDFAAVSPMKDDRDSFDTYIGYFNQMLAIADDTATETTEIENNYPSDGTMEVLTNGLTVTGTLRHVDRQDAIRLGSVSNRWFTGNGSVHFDLTAKGVSIGDLTMDFYRRDFEGGVELLESRKAESSVDYAFKGVGDCFVMLRGTNVQDKCDYELKATVQSLDPDSSRTEYLVQDGTGKVKVSLAEGVLYRVENVVRDDAVFEPSGTTDFYKAKKGGEVELTLADKAKPLVIQKWIPGTVGFVAEPDGSLVRKIKIEGCGEGGFTNVIALSRFVGLSGKVKACVKVDKDLTSLQPWRYSLLDADGREVDAVDVSWSDNGISGRSIKVVVFDDNVFDGFERELVLDVGEIESERGEVTVAGDKGGFTLQVIDEDVWYICQNIRVDATYEIPGAAGIDLKGEFLKKENWPSGINLKIDNERKCLVASGATKAKPGLFSATYRITAKASGITFMRDFLINGAVIDPAAPGTDPDDPEGKRAYNASCVNARTYKDIPLTQTVPATNGAAAYAVLDGVLKVTIAKGAGKISAKYACGAGNISFTSKQGVFIDEDTHAFTATMAASSKKFRDYRLTVNALPDGSVEARLLQLGADEVPVKDLCGTALGAPWSKANPASRWQGYYTAFFEPGWVETNGIYAVSEGRPYLTLKMETKSAINNGTVKWAGMLPSGKSVSGSSALTVAEDGAYLPAFKKVSKDVFAGLMRIIPDAKECKEDGGGAVFSPAESVYSVWRHVEKKSEDLSYNVYYNVYGAIYDHTSDALDCCCERDYGRQATNMTFSIRVPVPFPVSLSYGTLDVTGDTLVTFNAYVGSDTIEFDDANVDKWNAKLKFAKKTGVVSGSFDMPFREKTVKAKFKGVVTIGFGNGCGCHDDTLTLPFVNGSWYISDKIGDAAGTAVSVKRGGAIDLEVK